MYVIIGRNKQRPTFARYRQTRIKVHATQSRINLYFDRLSVGSFVLFAFHILCSFSSTFPFSSSFLCVDDVLHNFNQVLKVNHNHIHFAYYLFVNAVICVHVVSHNILCDFIKRHKRYAFFRFLFDILFCYVPYFCCARRI